MIYAMMVIVAAVLSLGTGLLIGAHNCDKQLQMTIVECRALEARIAELLGEVSKLKSAAPKPRIAKPKSMSAAKLFGRGPNNAS